MKDTIIKGVMIGDKFIKKTKSREDICTVVDIYTVTNSRNIVVKYICIAEYETLDQKVQFEVPFATVVRNGS